MNDKSLVRTLMRCCRIFIVLVLSSSCNDKRLDEYKSIIREADRFEIIYTLTNKKVILKNELVPKLKDVLTRNVKPETQRKLVENIRIAIYKNNRQTSFLIIGYDNIQPYINFNSANLNFGFRLTYGISQGINNIYNDSDR